MKKINLGGDRLGSGKKISTSLNNYQRSTHDLGNVFRSTMAPGTLVPFYKKLALNGDTWTIDLTTLVKTMPAIGPLFGTYKIQMDMFSIPIRLYNGILHSNYTAIGMDMAKVKLPKMTLSTTTYNTQKVALIDETNRQISPSSLAAYLGLHGICEYEFDKNTTQEKVTRDINAVPFLAYYDIYKNYYCNKQEKVGKICTWDGTTKFGTIENLKIKRYEYSTEDYLSIMRTFNYGMSNYNDTITLDGITYNSGANVIGDGKILYNSTVEITMNGVITDYIVITYLAGGGTYYVTVKNGEIASDSGKNFKRAYLQNNVLTLETINYPTTGSVGFERDCYIKNILYNGITTYEFDPTIQTFNLDNIDDLRKYLFQNMELGTAVNINNYNKMPYAAITKDIVFNCNICDLNGLALKTYQSDIFNNWLASDWVEKINSISAVDTSNGSFSIDSLNLANKVYKMLNRVAISGGTYQDWQQAVYGEDSVNLPEIPVYCGGMSGYISFEEVVSTANTETANGGDSPLGSLAGKGILTSVKGGHVEIKIKEPSYIMGICSITPLIDYNQGNDFDLTEIESLDDLHKPALDQIGFQDLLIERAAWWGTTMKIDNTTGEIKYSKQSGGKTPAWMEYMTSVNQVYGDFGKKNELGFMVLTRDYERGLKSKGERVNIDWTTYINPSKYNYQFAETTLASQNFWVQIGIKAIARRKISAKIIPNL